MPKEAPTRTLTVWDDVNEVQINMDEITDLFEVKVILVILFKANNRGETWRKRTREEKGK